MNFTTKFMGEFEIQRLIKDDNNCSAHFTYETTMAEDKVRLALTTYNPQHKTHFLLHHLEGKTAIDCLEKMYNHIYELKTTLKNKDNHYLLYQIEWYCPHTQKIESSSFYGETIEQVLMKFNHCKKEKLVIYNMKLTPTA